jgi:maltose phosphorylase
MPKLFTNLILMLEFTTKMPTGKKNFGNHWSVKHSGNEAFVTARTFKTHFTATTFMQNTILLEGSKFECGSSKRSKTPIKFSFLMKLPLLKDKLLRSKNWWLYGFLNHENTITAAKNSIVKST